MKEIAQKILNSPFNWTGLTLRELVNAGRIPKENLKKNFEGLARGHLNHLYGGFSNVDIDEYLNEKEELIKALEVEFSSNN